MKVNKQKEALLTQEYLKSILNYNPDTGVFIWIKKTHPKANSIRVGEVAGNLQKSTGYYVIMINNEEYKAHRLAWLYTKGHFPFDDEPEIDHIDRDKSNNRIENLRVASRSENTRNVSAYKNNKLGVKGVRQTPNGRFQAYIKNPLRGQEYLGTYNTKEEASSAYELKSQEYSKDFYQAGPKVDEVY